MGKQKQDSHHGNQKLDVINREKKWRMRQVTAVLKTKIMTFGPITSSQMVGKQWKQ